MSSAPAASDAKLEILQAESATDMARVRELFLEYANSLSFSLCFQGFEQELKNLPGDYAPPHGRLLLARLGNEAAGCIALHRFQDDICEMKRLFVRPAFRGHSLGRILMERVITEARALGYARMRLDTIPSSMKEAVAIYQKRGFREIPPYRENPIPGALYLELAL